jgi:RHS repeat-associated protein
VDLPTGDVVEYVVDGGNRRVGKLVNGALVKQWLWKDRLRIPAELDGSGNLVSQFVYGDRSGTTPELVIQNGAVYRVVSDHLGSVRALVNINDATDVPVDLSYDVFGSSSGAGAGIVPQGFAGGLYDSDTGLVRFGARDYDARVRRWVAKDPVRFVGGRNLFVYSENDAINFFDPHGRSPAAAGAGVGAWFGLCAVQALRDTDKYSSRDDRMKHCVASCVFNRCTLLAFPWLTAGAGYLWERAQGWTDLGHESEGDLIADLEGILGSYDLGSSCEEACRPVCPLPRE